MQNTSRGTRKWLSVRMALVLVEIFIGMASIPAGWFEFNEDHHRGETLGL